jgi:PAS domain S-box-containing protein
MHDLMSDAPCGFVAFADDGTLVEVNQTLAGLLAYPRVELLGWHVEKLLPPGGRIFYHTYLFPMLKVQGSVEEIYLALRTKDGRDIPMLLNGRREERDGVFISDCVCMRMIQRHEYEEQLLEARKLAEESNAAKAKFLSMMSHDLRAPLTTIDGNAQLLALEPLTPDQRESLEAIRDACRMQMTLINDILEFARLDSGHITVNAATVPVHDVVSRATAFVRVQAADAGLTLAMDAGEWDVSVTADANRLQQIVLNLLTNAIKFTPPGGRISLGCDASSGRVRIRVRDTGIGIEPGALQRVFSPFVQLGAALPRPSVSGGVGLGLAISRDLARAMGGDVTAESDTGTGSVFTVELPAAYVSDERDDRTPQDSRTRVDEEGR